jgi:hypothetical protein
LFLLTADQGPALRVKASGDWYKMMAHEIKVIRDFGAAKRPRSLGRERDLVFYPF